MELRCQENSLGATQLKPWLCVQEQNVAERSSACLQIVFDSMVSLHLSKLSPYTVYTFLC